MAQRNRPQIKDDDQYESLRKEGMSREKAARIANTDRKTAAKRGGASKPYEQWMKDELYDRAKEIGIQNRSSMTKDELVKALRNH